MGRTYSQRLKRSIVIRLVAVLVLVGLALAMWAYTSIDKEVSEESSYKSMVTFQGALYSWVDDIDALPSGVTEVAQVEKPLGTSAEPISPNDGDLVSNSFPKGSKIYKDADGLLYLCQEGTCSRFQRLSY